MQRQCKYLVHNEVLGVHICEKSFVQDLSQMKMYNYPLTWDVCAPAVAAALAGAAGGRKLANELVK